MARRRVWTSHWYRDGWHAVCGRTIHPRRFYSEHACCRYCRHLNQQEHNHA